MFVLKLDDKYMQHQSNVGFGRTVVNWTSDINAASVFSYLDADLSRRSRELGTTRIAVNVTRIVTEIPS